MELSELVACTLSETDLKTQRERWLALGENFGLGREETIERSAPQLPVPPTDPGGAGSARRRRERMLQLGCVERGA